MPAQCVLLADASRNPEQKEADAVENGSARTTRDWESEATFFQQRHFKIFPSIHYLLIDGHFHRHK